jgi:hypothetical protein
MIENYSESYNGSEIVISVEAHTGTGTHTIYFLIDSVVQFSNATVTNTTIEGVFAEGLQALKDQIDAVEDVELNQILEGLGFTIGSEPILDYVVTAAPGAGSFTHTWTNDPDIDIESLQQADDDAFTVNLTTIHTGALSSPIVDSGVYGSGVLKYFRIRGQRTGEPAGPWSYGSATTT